MSKTEIISKLKQDGKSIKEIMNITGLSKSGVLYHTSEKIRENLKKTHSEGDTLKYKRLYGKIKRFNKRGGYVVDNITTESLKTKYPELKTKCYLTGVEIDLVNDVYHFDHINPVSQGGDNAIGNLGITTVIANQSKSSMTLDEYIEHCKLVLTNHGYHIVKYNAD